MFNTNIKKLRFYLIAIVFSALALTFTYISVYKIMLWPNLFDQREYRWNMADNDYVSYSFYKDEHTLGKYYPAFIKSKIQQGNLMEFFLTYEKNFDLIIERMGKKAPQYSLADAIQVFVDTIPINNLKWHPTSVKEYQIGVSCMIPIEQFKNGEHLLKITRKENTEIMNKDANSKVIEIPFWIDRGKTTTNQVDNSDPI
jgi:hypothetical protein